MKQSATPQHQSLHDSSLVTDDAVRVLTWGFRISLGLILLGLILAFIRQESLSAELGSPVHVFDQLISGHAEGILGVGILVMIISPIAATISITIDFFRVNDRRYGYISLAVVLILVASIAWSLV